MSAKKVNQREQLSEEMVKLSINGETPKNSVSNTGVNSESTPRNRSKNNRKKKQTTGATPEPRTEKTTEDKPIILLSDIGGYGKQINQLKDLIEVPINKWSEIKQMAISLPKTVLIFGPTGTGKTTTIKAFCYELSRDNKMKCFDTNCATILGKTFATSEHNLREIFDSAVKESPSLVFLDNFEMICSNRKSNSDQEKRLISVLSSILDNDLPKDKHIVVIFATNKPDSIDTNLRRPGRIDREIEFPVPLPSERLTIFKLHLNQTNCEVSDDVLQELAQSAHSYTGADVGLVCRESALSAVKDNRVVITKQDLLLAMKCVRPSAMREISLEVPNVFWSDIGGMQSIRDKLTQCVVWPLTNPEAFLRLGIEAPKGVLMYGPPGCCKTMIGKALATESNLNFLAIKGPELFNKWVGESERAVRELFRKAKAASPSILFFDEIDALAVERGVSQSTVGDRVLTQLLTEIDGIEQLNGVVIVAATNRPDLIDKAFMRPGRLDSVLYVPLPDIHTRYEIFRIRTGKMSVNHCVQQSLQSLAERTESYTGAEITAVCQEAGLLALESDINCKEVESKHFDTALEVVKPRISPKMIESYEEFGKQFKENINKINENLF